MKNLKKILGIITMIIGIIAMCLVESEVPLWATLLICLVGITGLFGGIVLYGNNCDEPMVD